MATVSSHNNNASRSYRWVSGLISPLFFLSLVPIAWGDTLTLIFILLILAMQLFHVAWLVAHRQLAAINDVWVAVCAVFYYFFVFPEACKGDDMFVTVCFVLWGIWLVAHYATMLFCWIRKKRCAA